MRYGKPSVVLVNCLDVETQVTTHYTGDYYTVGRRQSETQNISIGVIKFVHL